MARNRIVQTFSETCRNIWEKLPPTARESRPARRVGQVVHRAVSRRAQRLRGESTWFFRNLPLLQTLGEQVRLLRPNGDLFFCDIGCSSGAEVYSAVWVLHSILPHVRLVTIGVDISPDLLERARQGKYTLGMHELRGQIQQGIMEAVFDRDGDNLTIRSSLAEGIRWIAADVRDARLVSMLGSQDVVMANNLLIHMEKDEALDCTRNLLRLVRPGGMFVCRGMDLDVREKVAAEFGLRPVTTRLEEIHYADAALDAPSGWPWHYWGLEPLDKSRKNWVCRYAAIFQLPEHPS